MTDEELIARHPRVWHMAAAGMWPSIQKRGLLSVTALLDLFGVEGEERFAIESARRPQCVRLTHPEHGEAIIRDNKPMFEKSLLKCLDDGMTPREWYEILNAKSFFWTDWARLIRLLGARAYAKDPQTVIEVDTAELVARHREAIRLCPINSGETLYVPRRRGRATFKRIGEQPAATPIVELVVENGVPDLADMVIRVDRVEKGQWSQIWP